MSPQEALRKAIEICGSEAELARRLGITYQAVNQWASAPPMRVIEIERATGGEVSRHDLRPDIYPREDGEDRPHLSEAMRAAS